MQLCNLTEINASNLESQEDFNDRCKAATIIGTLQASYTNFHYLRHEWKLNSEKDALIGISLTGIASLELFKYNIEEGANIVKEVNEQFAETIGINPAARCTVVKPAGTTSLVLGTSSGIHAWHNDYYIRRIRVNKNEPIYSYLSIYHPELLEDCHFRPHDTAIIKVPQHAPKNSVLRRNETALELLDRVKSISEKWIKTGHRSGYNYNNVSCTISVKNEEWDEVREWMWNNREFYTGIAMLPFSDHTYIQPPFEDCTKEVYEEMIKSLTNVDLSKVVEIKDGTNFGGEAACAGGNCEIK